MVNQEEIVCISLCSLPESDDIPMFIRQCELNNVNVFNQQDGHIIRRDGVETSR